MKKGIFNIALATVLALVGMTSCSSSDMIDESLPKVDFSIAISGGVGADGMIYVVQGSDLNIDAIYAESSVEGEDAVINHANYFFDTDRLGTSAVEPYGKTIHIASDARLGVHNLAIECPVSVTGREKSVANLYYFVKVVGSVEEIPDVPMTFARGNNTISVNSRIHLN